MHPAIHSEEPVMGFSLANKKINDYYTPKKLSLLAGTIIRNGSGRPDDIKESNYIEIQKDLTSLGINNKKDEVTEAAGILGTVLGRVVEVKEPPADNGAARSLKALKDDSSTVQALIQGIDVRLDVDQLKHQHKDNPIGTRHKGGGNRFSDACDADWHRQNTLPYMATWAVGLGVMQQGEKQYHGQATPVNNVHYEGYCLMANGQKYVAFHCYPSNNSPLLGPKG
jgi:hypothetical protein